MNCMFKCRQDWKVEEGDVKDQERKGKEGVGQIPERAQQPHLG